MFEIVLRAKYALTCGFASSERPMSRLRGVSFVDLHVHLSQRTPDLADQGVRLRSGLMLKFTNWNSGTRAEILAELRNGNAGTRSKEKHAALSAAISAIEGGAPHVRVGRLNWVVQGEASRVVDLFVAELDGSSTEV